MDDPYHNSTRFRGKERLGDSSGEELHLRYYFSFQVMAAEPCAGLKAASAMASAKPEDRHMNEQSNSAD